MAQGVSSFLLLFASRLPGWNPSVDNHPITCYTLIMIIKHCLICQSPFKVSPSGLSYRKTCSKECDAKWRRQSGRYSGKNNPAYKGGVAIYKHSHGQNYKLLRGQSGKIYEHRYIMEQVLGRKLERWEEVHHINGNTLDNRPDNLYVFDKRHHSRFHLEMCKRVQKLEQENKRLKAKLISFSSLPLPLLQ